MLRVGIVTEHQLEASGIRATLADHPGVCVAAEAGPEGESRLVRHTRVDVLVSCQPTAEAALRSLRRVAAAAPRRRQPVLVLLTAASADGVRRVLAAGAKGVLRRGTAAAHLPWAVHAAARDGLALDPGLSRAVVAAYVAPVRADARTAAARRLMEALTPRERDVLAYAAEGLATADIAAELSVSGPTVKAHLQHIYAKLRVSGRLQAVRLAWDAGSRSAGTAGGG